MSRIFKIASAIIATSLVLAPAALADQVSRKVAYGDLDMSKPADGAVLLKRIEGAASRVCNGAISHSPIHPYAQSKCRRETVQKTVRDLNIGMLTLAWSGAYPAPSMAVR